MYIPEYFKLYEVLPKEFYDATYPVYGDKLWLMFDDRGLRTLDAIRIAYGPIVLNNWFFGGNNQLRGWRPMQCKTGAKISQHKFGRGFDFKPVNCTVETIREDCKTNPWEKCFQLITCIEDDVSWFHMDFRNYDKLKEGLKVIKP